MRYLFYLFVNLTLLSFTVKAQTIPAGANGIELTTSLSDSTLFESVQSYLENEGFAIDNADEDSATIVTEYKLVYGATQIRILASVEKGVVIFTGQGMFDATGQSYEDEPLINEGSADDSIKGGFISFNGIINRYAQTLALATLEYTVP